MWQPCLSIFDSEKALSVGSYSFILQPENNVQNHFEDDDEASPTALRVGALIVSFTSMDCYAHKII